MYETRRNFVIIVIMLIIFSKFFEHFYAQNNVSQHNWSSFTNIAGCLKDSIHLKFIARLKSKNVFAVVAGILQILLKMYTNFPCLSCHYCDHKDNVYKKRIKSN